MSTLSVNLHPVHIVIGAGSSGCMVCHELAKFGNVILIEKGSRHGNESNEVTNPTSWGEAYSKSRSSFRNNTRNQKNLLGKNILIPHGFGVGGATNINAMIWTAGNKSVFDKYWPDNWNSVNIDRLLNYAKDIIQPTTIIPTTILLPKSINIIKSKGNNAKQRKYDSLSKDEMWDNGHNHMSYLATITPLDQRISMGNKILQPLEDIGRLTIIAETEVLCIEIENKATGENAKRRVATGVRVRDRSGVERIIQPKNGGSIVLSSGAFYSPCILARSGLGNGDVYNSTKILEGPYLPALGTHLLDHSVLPFIAIGNWWRKHAMDKHIQSEGHSLNGVHGWINLDQNGHIHNPSSGVPPRIQLLFVDGRILPGMLSENILPHFESIWLYSHIIRPVLRAILNYLVTLSIIKYLLSFVFGVLICNVQPYVKHGGGYVDTSSLYHKNTFIDLNFANTEQENRISMKALKFVREYLSDRKSDGLWYLELLPGPLFLYALLFPIFKIYNKIFTSSYFHFCGTCRMINTLPTSSTKGKSKSHRHVSGYYSESDRISNNGKDESDVYAEGVVDEQLKVIGVDNLRVADSSVFPALPSGPISAICMAIGLGAGELINKELDELFLTSYQDDHAFLYNHNNSSRDSESSRDEFDDACIE